MARKSVDEVKKFIDPASIYSKLDRLNPIDRIKITTQLIEVCRDTLMVDLATIRRRAALEARRTMRPREIAVASESSPQTIGRLLAEATAMYRADDDEL